MSHPSEDDLLSVIDAKLARAGPFTGMPLELRASYVAERDADRRRYNWIGVMFITLIFDVFVFGQIKSAPELVALSAWLRFGALTPLVLLFVFLDRAKVLSRSYDPLLLLFALTLGAISAYLCLLTTSTDTLSDLRATPLILLGTTLLLRAPPPFVVVNATLSVAMFIGGLLLNPVIPRAEIPSLALASVAIAIGQVLFNLRLEMQDRRVFLLNIKERMLRAMVADKNEVLLREANSDALTGVGNRRFFDEVLQKSWRNAWLERCGLAVVMIDVDHFKKYNDHYGHQAGDDCLRAVAARLRAGLRSGDLLARYGGEEFAVVLAGGSEAAACAAAGHMCMAVQQMALPHAGIGPNATVTVSLGVAGIVPAGANGASMLVQAADQALYRAKQQGRNCVRTADLAACVAPARGNRWADESAPAGQIASAEKAA